MRLCASGYPGLPRQLAPVLAWPPLSTLTRYVMQLSTDLPAQRIWLSLRGPEVPHPRARHLQRHTEGHDGQDASRRRRCVDAKTGKLIAQSPAQATANRVAATTTPRLNL
jgi:hypothetical protein